jgi:twitching motility protein PilT
VATSGEQPAAQRPGVEPYVPERYAFEPGREPVAQPPDTPAHLAAVAPPAPQAPPAAGTAPTPSPRRALPTPTAGLPGPLPTPAPLTVPRGGHHAAPAVQTPARPQAHDTRPTQVVADSDTDPGAYERAMTEQRVAPGDLDLNRVLAELVTRSGSDLHLSAGNPPVFRLHGELTRMDEYEALTPHVIQRVMYSIITQKQRERFEEQFELDFSYAVPDVARFRVNLYRQREALGAAFRLIPFDIKPLEELGVPPTIGKLAALARGMVLVTGPTGSGKSTTLASLIDLANRTRRDHIMTVEDPIEFLHDHKLCLVNQREVGADTHSFANALKHVLRQDPDIILVGEMRDLETISVALTAAETGHLVFATLHTQDAAQTIDRVIDVFPPHQQQQVRVQLAATLQGVVCQTLCRRSDGRGRVVAAEVMFATPAIRNLIREGKTHQVYSAMQAGGQFGMQTLDQHLAELVRNGRITYEDGVEKCHHVEDFKRLAGRA